MRYVVTLILSLCMLDAKAQSSSLNLIAQGGGLWNSRSNKPTTFVHSSPFRAMGAAGVSYRKDAVEAGFLLGYRGDAFIQEGDVVFKDQFDPLTGTITKTAVHMRFVEGWSAVALTPFFKYHLLRGRLDYYAGFMPTYLNWGRATYTDTLMGHKSSYGPTAHGFALDAVAGAGCSIGPFIG